VIKTKVVVLDEFNHWLFYGEVETKEDAIEQAKLCDEYDPEATLYVFEIKREL